MDGNVPGNKTIFYLLQKYAEENDINVDWIYLEKGHGKGISDGISATVKNAISNLYQQHPENPMYNVKELITMGLPELIPSISVSEHTTEEIKKIASEIMY
jgi:hypothetical protein